MSKNFSFLEACSLCDYLIPLEGGKHIGAEDFRSMAIIGLPPTDMVRPQTRLVAIFTENFRLLRTVGDAEIERIRVSAAAQQCIG
jgi:hypothetical protein